MADAANTTLFDSGRDTIRRSTRRCRASANRRTEWPSPTESSSISARTRANRRPADYQVVKDLHSADVIGTYDAAVITKDSSGKVHVNKDEMAARHNSARSA